MCFTDPRRHCGYVALMIAVKPKVQGRCQISDWTQSAESMIIFILHKVDRWMEANVTEEDLYLR